MKARHIKRIRTKLTNRKFLTAQLIKWAQEEQRIEHFWDFKCSEFFEGKTMAEINKVEYWKRYHVCQHKLAQAKRLLKLIPDTKA